MMMIMITMTSSSFEGYPLKADTNRTGAEGLSFTITDCCTALPGYNDGDDDDDDNTNCYGKNQKEVINRNCKFLQQWLLNFLRRTHFFHANKTTPLLYASKTRIFSLTAQTKNETKAHSPISS